MKAKLFILLFGILGVAAQVSANEKIYVNSEVTTHIVMPENIKLVDIPTAKSHILKVILYRRLAVTRTMSCWAQSH